MSTAPLLVTHPLYYTTSTKERQLRGTHMGRLVPGLKVWQVGKFRGLTSLTSLIRSDIMPGLLGTTYWGYATKYALVLIDAVAPLLPSVGNDWVNTPGFLDTGLFRLHHTGPANRTFNWADASESSSDEFIADYMLLSQKTDTLRNVYAYQARRQMTPIVEASCQSAGCALMLLAFTDAGSHTDVANQPTTAYFSMGTMEFANRTIVGSMRTSWDDNATWLAFRGGDGEANHNDLDAGSFVFDMQGYHWAIDFGAGNYGLPGYFDKGTKPNQRYSWYRKSTRGHNTWCFNGSDSDVGNSDQDMNALSFISSQSDRQATIDLTSAYAKYGVKKLERTFHLNGTGVDARVIISDVIQTSGKLPMEWTMNTRANVTLSSDGLTATLVSGNISIKGQLTASSGIVFTTKTVNPAPPNEKINGVTRLMVCLSAAQSEDTTVLVQFQSA
eukprot:m.98087 g.98087  ORF g.98087 m.98087 type:complete len:443 (-) comp15068_c0_seq2:46-1374(-)